MYELLIKNIFLSYQECVKDRNFKFKKEAKNNDHQIEAGDGGVMSGI